MKIEHLKIHVKLRRKVSLFADDQLERVVRVVTAKADGVTHFGVYGPTVAPKYTAHRSTKRVNREPRWYREVLAVCGASVQAYHEHKAEVTDARVLKKLCPNCAQAVTNAAAQIRDEYQMPRPADPLDDVLPDILADEDDDKLGIICLAKFLLQV